MLIGVVSDTHGQVRSTLQAIEMLKQFDLEAVLHCGDIGSPAIVGLFSPWKTHFVFGNVDYDRDVLETEITAGGHASHGEFGDLSFGETKIALLHGDDTRRLRQTIHSGQWQIVCHGHTHIAKREQVGPTLVLNPGAIHRANPHSIALVELPSREVTSIQL